MQGRCQVGFVDQGPAAGVDQQGRGFHQGQALGIDQLAGLAGERTVQADHITVGQQGSQIGVARTGGTAMNQDLHAEGGGDARHRCPNPPHPHHAKGLAGQLLQVALPIAEIGSGTPTPLVHARVVAAGAVGQFQDEGKDGLGHGGRGVLGHMAEGQTPGRRRHPVHHVVAGGQHRHPLEVGGCGELSLPQGGFIGDHHRGSSQPCGDEGGWRAGIDLEGTEPLQGLPGEVPGVGGLAIKHNQAGGAGWGAHRWPPRRGSSGRSMSRSRRKRPSR